jgi:hypothetical protein
MISFDFMNFLPEGSYILLPSAWFAVLPIEGGQGNTLRDLIFIID